MRVNHNLAALHALRQGAITEAQLNQSLERLSSGLRINRAADDAAGLAVSERMRAQVRSIDQAIRNAQDGVSLIQTAEGALNEDSAIIQRIRELALQAQSDTLTAEDRLTLQREVEQLIDEVDRVAQTTEFNTLKLLTGSYTGKKLQIGPNAGTFYQLTVSFRAMTAMALSLKNASGAKLSVSTASKATAALTKLDAALDKLSNERATMGAWQNRLQYAIASLSISQENMTAAESRIRDVDMAAEMMAFTRAQILTQAGATVMVQANLSIQVVLQLLRG
ncbi:MAG: flagellin [Acetobacteraceae bacterium]|nr:flagellin [Acetobacteraceae bacterium]